MRRLPKAAALIATPAFAIAVLCLGPDPIAVAAGQPLLHRDSGFVGAHACKTCHGDHHASWRATFHATMTQRPSATTIRGEFDGRSVHYGDRSGRVFMDGERFAMEVPSGGGTRQAEVALVVGSHRYQQYFERIASGDTASYVRLPLLWHIEQRRWLHVNTVFLSPDDHRWDATAATWNENCIFCHNTGPQPRMVNYRDPQRRPDDLRFDSLVADLGIACETCHGPGAAHAAAQQNPVTRYRHQFQGGGDPTIVLPTRLSQEEAVSVCGQCHGARLPAPITRMDDWLTTGPTFRAGERLKDHATPITATTPVHGSADPELFALRFWADGTPRLSAYEYQGTVASACYRGGQLTCQHCHAMHDSDPRGQLRRDLPGDALCTQCHAGIGRDVAAHTHHPIDSTGSRCVACHMPKIVYGVAGILRSHRIEVPDSRRDAEHGRPNACTLCHVDRSPIWSSQQLQKLWGGHGPVPARRRDGAPIDYPDALASLLAGDAAQRAVYASALGQPGIACADDHAAALRAWLAISMGDGYPSVRRLAQLSLQALEREHPLGIGTLLASIDDLAGPERRRQSVFGVLDSIAARAPGRLAPPASGVLLGHDFRVDLPAAVALTNRQRGNLISVGE